MTDVEQATSANWLKRCFSIQESQYYLGLRRSAFEKHIAPLLEGKGTQVGVTVLFERADLDASLGGLQGICPGGRCRRLLGANRRPSGRGQRTRSSETQCPPIGAKHSRNW